MERGVVAPIVEGLIGAREHGTREQEHGVGTIGDSVYGVSVKHFLANQERVLCAVFSLEGDRHLCGI